MIIHLFGFCQYPFVLAISDSQARRNIRRSGNHPAKLVEVKI